MSTLRAIGGAAPQRALPSLLAELVAASAVPVLSLGVAGGELVSVRSGGIVALTAPTGVGKTSLAAQLLRDHAREHGPAVFLSVELPADELAARIVGMTCDASWEDVLRGRVPRAEMERALALPRLLVVDRRRATLENLATTLRAARTEHGDAPLLAAVDYVQALPSPDPDRRGRVEDAMARIDEVARAHLAVVVVVSQVSRPRARALRAGELVGAETTDSGAESSAIERWASVTLSLGAQGSPAADGTQAVQLSIGKCRMGAGDRVVPMRYDGRTGRWTVDGEARPAAEVRAEAVTERDARTVTAAQHAIRDLLARADAPMSRRDVRGALGLRDEAVRAAVAKLLADPGSGVVEVEPRRNGSYPLWAQDRARAAGRRVRGPS